MKILTGGGGGLRKFLDIQKGGSEKISVKLVKKLYTSKPIGGGRLLQN